MAGPDRVSHDVVEALGRRLRALEAGTATREVVVQVAACEVCGAIVPHSGRLCPDCRARLADARSPDAARDGGEPELASLLASVPGAVFRAAIDPRRTVVYASPRIVDVTGYTHADFRSGRCTLASITHPDDRVAVAHELALALGGRGAWELEYRVIGPDGGVRWVSEHGQAAQGGARPTVVGVLVDVTDRRQRRDQLARMAIEDPLTGLPNRRALAAALSRDLLRLRVRGRPLAVAAVDVDLFKAVNDMHGHQAGDRVLVGVAERLRACTTQGQLVARTGGEEFAWTMPDVPLPAAVAAAERLRRSVEAAPVGGIPAVTISVGVAGLAPGERADALLARADAALYAAKQGGRNRVVAAPAPPAP